MAEAISVSSAIGAEEKVLSLETGVLAGQANGSVVVTIGRTKVLSLPHLIKMSDPELTFSH